MYYNKGLYKLAGEEIIDLYVYPSSFDNIMNELKRKYPKVECNNSELHNNRVVFNQVICKLEIGNSTLLATKYHTWNLDRGSILIFSNK